MYRKLLNGLRGRAVVQVCCAAPERVVNLCAAHGIPFWDVTWLAEDTFRVTTTLSGARRLPAVTADIGAQVQVVEKSGVPELWRRGRHRYVLLAAPFMAMNFVLNQSLRAEGSAVFSMIGMVSGAVINVALDPIFIFVLDWGVAGASAATAISKLISWVILMTPYFRGKTLLKIKLSRFHPTREDAWGVCSMGSSSFFRNGLATLAAILLNRIAVGYSESALAAISVANRVTMFMTSACLGFGQGFLPVAGYSWGARRFDRVKEAFRFSKLACVVGITVFAALVAIFAKPLLLCFTEEDEELVRIGVFSLRMQCLAMPLHGYAIIVNMLSSGIGRAFNATLMGLSRQGICFYPILPVMSRCFGVWGIASLQAAADILTTAIAVPIDISTTKLVNEKMQTENAPVPQKCGA